MFMERLKAPFRLLLDMIYPPRCAACGEEVASAHTLCYACFSSVRMLAGPECACCGEPFEYALAKDALCGECLQELPSYDQARSVMVYDEASSRMITSFKYSDRTHLSVLLSRLLSARAKELSSAADLIMPVPLHWRRFLSRRYNQSYLLARELARSAEKPLMHRLLRRTKYTLQQTGLSRAERRKNVQSAFRVAKKKYPQVKDKTVLLVDDVLTTGATVEACAKALKKAGAQKVMVVTVARRVNRS